jgi:hypothetical protein
MMNQTNIEQPVSYDKNLRVCCGRPHRGLKSISIKSVFVYDSVRIFLTSPTDPLSPKFDSSELSKDVLKQSIDNGIFTNESIDDMAFLQNNKEKFTVCDKIIALSEGSDIGNFAILCDNNFKPQRELYRQKISKASENFIKLENRTHPFHEFLCPHNGESEDIVICHGKDANCENSKRIRALEGKKAHTAMLDLFARGGDSYVSQISEQNFKSLQVRY